MRPLSQTFLLLMLVVNSIHAQNIYPWPSSGNIGIGTTSPGNKLSVIATTYNDGIFCGFDGSSYGLPAGFASLHGSSLQNGSYNGITIAGDAGIVYGQTNGASPALGFVITPWTAGTTGLRLDKNGNVSINTNDSKGYQLAVNGQAIFTRAVVKLTQNWPDYVFQEDYRLLSLDSLTHYIRLYKHLPDMPAAEYMERNGLDLGATQGVLVKKIEELTLYTIDQDNTVKRQKLEIQILNERLEKLEKMVAELTTNH